MLKSVWPALKRWRALHVGPVSLVFSFRRRVRVSAGSAVVRAQAPVLARARPVPAARATLLPQLAVIVGVGVGDGFGHALAELLASEGYRLALVCRNAAGLAPLVHRLALQSPAVAAFGCDATHEAQVQRLFDGVLASLGQPTLVVYCLQEFGRSTVVQTSAAAFESAWRHNCFGAFLVARTAGRVMLPLRQGSIILVGSTSSLIAREEHLNLAVGKFGQRALAQAMARELWPFGIHVAHVVIDADIREGAARSHTQAQPEDLAYSVLALHRQPESAWTSELDLRPARERFWEHC